MKITDQNLRQLRSEALSAGDELQVELCNKALSGDVFAREECARVIENARAQEDEIRLCPRCGEPAHVYSCPMPQGFDPSRWRELSDDERLDIER